MSGRQSLAENPLVAWSLVRTRREPRTVMALAGFLLLLYGIALFMFSALRRPMGSAERFCTSVYYLAWLLDAAVLLLVAPALLAQTVARERERGTLDHLRLSGLSGKELAWGFLARGVSLPLLLVATSAPLLLIGLGGEDGPLVFVRSLYGLTVTAPLYLLVGALAGLVVKKAQGAGSAAVFAVLSLAGLGLSGFTERDAAPLSILAPWGAAFAGDSKRFHVPFLGGRVPGELVQLPVVAALSVSLFRSLSDRLGGGTARLLGYGPAHVLLAVSGALSAATFVPGTSRWDPDPGGLVFRQLLLLLGAGLVAVESGVGYRELVRGLARRDPDDPPRAEERLELRRFAPGLILLVVAELLMALAVTNANEVHPGQVLASAAVVLGTGLFLTVAFQAAGLMTRDLGYPRVLAAVITGVVWLGPLISMALLDALIVGGAGTPRVLPALLCPPVALVAAADGPSSSIGGLSGESLALGSAALQVFLALGLRGLLLRGWQRAEEEAASLVALPADAYAPAGMLSKRCPRGHAFAADWQTCPHCPPEPD